MWRRMVQSTLLRAALFRYATQMASDRIMRAIGALDRAVGRLEADESRLAKSPPRSSPDRDAARQALRSLDDLMASLQAHERG